MESVQQGLKVASGEMAERHASEYYRELLLDCRYRFREKTLVLQGPIWQQLEPELFFVEQGFWQIENRLDL